MKTKKLTAKKVGYKVSAYHRRRQNQMKRDIQLYRKAQKGKVSEFAFLDNFDPETI